MILRIKFIDKTDVNEPTIRSGFWTYKLNSFIHPRLNLRDCINTFTFPLTAFVSILDLAYVIRIYSVKGPYSLVNLCSLTKELDPVTWNREVFKSLSCLIYLSIHIYIYMDI